MARISLSGLATGVTAATALSNIALVIPQSSNPSTTKGYQPLKPQGTNGITDNALPLSDALIFHFEDNNNVNLKSDITDHYVEDNSSVVDQIAVKPEMVTVKGFIGELNNVKPAVVQALQDVANNLVLVNSYAPAMSVTALQRIAQADFAYQSAKSIANSAVSAWSSITQGSGSQVAAGSGVFTVGSSRIQNLQQKMFQQFYGYWRNRTLFNVQTPWAVFTNMAIDEVVANQDGDTRVISSFDVTFKKIRTATTRTTRTTTLGSGRNALQSAALAALGSSSGVPGSSLGSSLAGVA